MRLKAALEDALAQCSLHLDQVVTHDPLYLLAFMKAWMNSSMSMVSEWSLSRTSIRIAVSSSANLSPSVAVARCNSLRFSVPLPSVSNLEKMRLMRAALNHKTIEGKGNMPVVQKLLQKWSF